MLSSTPGLRRDEEWGARTASMETLAINLAMCRRNRGWPDGGSLRSARPRSSPLRGFSGLWRIEAFGSRQFNVLVCPFAPASRPGVSSADRGLSTSSGPLVTLKQVGPRKEPCSTNTLNRSPNGLLPLPSSCRQRTARLTSPTKSPSVTTPHISNLLRLDFAGLRHL